MATPDNRRARSLNRACLLALLLALGAVPAMAQSTPSDTDGTAPPQSQPHSQRRHGRQASAQPRPASTAPAPVMREIWPRLDVGAVFCRTPQALNKHLSAVAAVLDNRAAEVAEPTDCRNITAPTAVTVLSRDGPARTEVQLSNTPPENRVDGCIPASEGP